MCVLSAQRGRDVIAKAFTPVAVAAPETYGAL